MATSSPSSSRIVLPITSCNAYGSNALLLSFPLVLEGSEELFSNSEFISRLLSAFFSVAVPTLSSRSNAVGAGKGDRGRDAIHAYLSMSCNAMVISNVS